MEGKFRKKKRHYYSANETKTVLKMSNNKVERMDWDSISFLQTYISDVFKDDMDAWKVSSKNSDIVRKS